MKKKTSQDEMLDTKFANTRAMVSCSADEIDEETIARMAIHPSLLGAQVIQSYSSTAFGGLELDACVGALKEQINDLRTGTLDRIEDMLMTQAFTLDAIFNALAIQANTAEFLPAFESNLRLALKAQSQSRATLQTLAAIKNPRTLAFIQHQNIGLNQQINNVSTDSLPAQQMNPHINEMENRLNELLEKNDGQRLDPCSACTPSRSDRSLETVGALDGSTHVKRKSHFGKKCR